MEIEEDSPQRVEDANYEANPPHLDGVPDMSSLIYLETPNVLHNLEVRYKRGEVYTSISKVLIAVNPYEQLDCYGAEVIKVYRVAAQNIKQRLRVDNLPPHVFKVSQAAHHNLMKTQTNQSMIVCGESGSGKTESAKHLMRYLASGSDGTVVASEKVSIEKQVLDANPILESFGNAKTILNNNSSRFGKFTKIVFAESQEHIVGSFIETYLLEKSRVVRQDLNERNYHIFYMLCAGARELPSDEAKMLQVGPPDSFYYLSQSKCVSADGWDDKERFEELRHAMGTLNFRESDFGEIMRVVAGILHLGNVEIVPDKRDLASIGNPESLKLAATLFGVDAGQLQEKFTTRTLKVVAQTIKRELSVRDAQLSRDALAKALYHGLFQFVVHRINDELYEEKARNPDLKWIGILDVFGFESFEHNSFEQFCINFANERLQQFFNNCILKSEQEEYLVEAIRWVPIKVPDNQDVIDLVDQKPSGILAALDSECQTPQATAETFIQNLFKLNRNSRLKQVSRIQKKGGKGVVPINGFSIQHYAGKVIYTVDDFLVKNADSASTESAILFENATNKVASQILSISPDSQGKKRESRPRVTPARAFRSTGGFFSSQLTYLMHTLNETNPYFVRCIKPNSEKRRRNFQWAYVRPQLECGGIIECLRMLKCGYPTRTTYEIIFQRYGKILQPTPPDLNKRDFCEAVLRVCGRNVVDRTEYQLGLTKVFFRPGKQEFLEALLQGPDLDEETVARIKRFLLNKRFQRARGGVRVHIYFTKMLREQRAQARLKRLFAVGKVIANTLVTQLQDARLLVASTTVQTGVRAVVASQDLVHAKVAAQRLSAFFAQSRFRQSVQAELQQRIQRKIAQISERERKIRLEKAEELRRQMQLQAEEKEKQRLAAIQAENEAKEAARKKQLEDEQRAMEEREQLRKEIAEQKRQQALLKDRLRQEEPLQDRIRELEAREHKLNEEREAFEMQKKEFLLTKTSSLGPDETPAGTDGIAQFVTSPFQFGVGSESSVLDSRTRKEVVIRVSQECDLIWSENSANGNQSGKELGKVPLISVSSITCSSDGGRFALSIRGTAYNGTDIRLDLVTQDEKVRNSWATALRYCVRNTKLNGTLSTRIGDPSRGNWLVAQLTDRVLELELELVRTKAAQVLPPSGSGLGEQVPEEQAVSPGRQSRKTLRPSLMLQQQKIPKETHDHLVDQIEKLKHEKGEVAQENNELRMLIEWMREQRALEIGAQKAKKEVEVQEALRTTQRARNSVSKAQQLVADAEEKVRRQQIALSEARKVLEKRQEELVHVQNTAKALNLDLERAGADPDDKTLAKFKKLYDEKKAAYDAAKADCDEAELAVVRESEELNQKNDLLLQKNQALGQEEVKVTQQGKGGSKAPATHRFNPRDKEGCLMS